MSPTMMKSFVLLLLLGALFAQTRARKCPALANFNLDLNVCANALSVSTLSDTCCIAADRLAQVAAQIATTSCCQFLTGYLANVSRSVDDFIQIPRSCNRGGESGEGNDGGNGNGDEGNNGNTDDSKGRDDDDDIDNDLEVCVN